MTPPLIAAATARPWRVFTTPDGRKLVGIGSQEGEGILDSGFGVWSWNDSEGIANANLVVESVNAHASLKARVAELEANERAYEAALGQRTYNEVALHIEELIEALRSASIQCGNVIYNCEQRPADNQRHLDSWKGVKTFIDAALTTGDAS